MKKEFTIDRAVHLLGAYFLLVCLNPREGNYEYLVSKGIIESVPSFFFGYDIVDSEHEGTKPLDLTGLRCYIKDGWRYTYGNRCVAFIETELFQYEFIYDHHSPTSRQRGDIT